jgi:hypothetical protein
MGVRDPNGNSIGVLGAGDYSSYYSRESDENEIETNRKSGEIIGPDRASPAERILETHDDRTVYTDNLIRKPCTVP